MNEEQAAHFVAGVYGPGMDSAEAERLIAQVLGRGSWARVAMDLGVGFLDIQRIIELGMSYAEEEAPC